jgi:hypothetical protein
LLVIVPLVAENVALLWLAGTVTLAGTGRVVLPPVSETEAALAVT